MILLMVAEIFMDMNTNFVTSIELMTIPHLNLFSVLHLNLFIVL